MAPVVVNPVARRRAPRAVEKLLTPSCSVTDAIALQIPVSDAIARDVVTAYIGLGANLGNAAAALRLAVQALGRLPHTQLLCCSAVYRTTPLDTDGGREVAADGHDYLNAVVALSTRLAPLALLDQLQRIEQAAGRERPYRNAPRTLDLDLLLYGDDHIDHPRLCVPHPRMMQRAFVLVPLADMAPGRVSTAQLAAVAHQGIAKAGTLLI
jgi:2-amino-4-hydroxy-6-hydroxymethyldihydropteridine diphosphokinase